VGLEISVVVRNDTWHHFFY